MFVLESIRQYARTDRTALINRGQRLSFAALEARSEAFAAWLLERFGDDRSPVVIYGHKQTDLLPCIYGALKSGRAYVPVDLVVPPERVGEIIADIGPRVIVDFSGEGLCTDCTVLRPDALNAVLAAAPAGPVDQSHWVRDDDVVYILFTSGSTGKPKGVPITVNNLTNFYRGLLPYLPEEEGGVVLHQISYSFDVSGCSIYAGLSRGMTLFTVDKEMVDNLGTLFDYLAQSELTMWVSTPSFAELCAQSGRFCVETLPYVRNFLFCGEVLTHKLCDTLAERFAGACVLNTYGPTEATVLVTAVRITEEMRRDERSIPIGQPLDEVELRLVDSAGRLLEDDGACGELLIVSDSVGPGYHRRSDLTAQMFFTDAITGKRGYRTGDICFRQGGLYYYSGRVDNQLKLNGYRVEMEDIENNLVQIENIVRAAVLPVWADKEHSRVQYLAAFVLLEADDGLTALARSVAIKRRAADFLPAYMIPRRITAVDAFPLNTNGKIDRKALARALEKAGAR